MRTLMARRDTMLRALEAAQDARWPGGKKTLGHYTTLPSQGEWTLQQNAVINQIKRAIATGGHV